MKQKARTGKTGGPRGIDRLPVLAHGLFTWVACAVLLVGTWPEPLLAQDGAAPAVMAAASPAASPPDNQGNGSGQGDGSGTLYTIEQLDALLAPIALYPDELLTQMLIASVYALQVVEAARWVEDPAHKALQGEALEKALNAVAWDPSVKSLVPFPEVLAMMNSRLDWLGQLGYAMTYQQAGVWDAVQRLRRQAQAAGSLQTTAQQVVSTVAATDLSGAAAPQQNIIIQPANPEVVYVPQYNPTTVYGTWPYPAYPPVYVPPLPGYAVGSALLTGLAFGAGVAITAGLWGWASPRWGGYGGGYANVNVNRYNSINVNRPPINNPNWRAGGAGYRPPGGGRPPPGPVGRPGRPGGVPANAIGRPGVSVPGGAVRPPAGMGPGANRPPINPGNRPGGGRPGQVNRPGAGGANIGQGNRPGGGNIGQGNRPGAGGANIGQGNRPAASARPAARPATRPAGGGRSPAAFNGMGDGRSAAQYGNRGSQSRQTAGQRGGGRGAGAAGARGGGGGGARGGGGGGGGRRR